jgi:hypothetical protein
MAGGLAHPQLFAEFFSFRFITYTLYLNDCFRAKEGD